MKIRALKKFEGIKDIERDVFPKEGDIWEVSEERANFLKSHGVIEFVEEVKEETPKVKLEVNIDSKKIEEKIIEVEPKIEKDPVAKEIKIQAVKEVQEIKQNKNKKHSKK